MEYYLEEFNNISKAPMSLVMFKFAIEHISRICRVLKQDNGHLLLVGIGGSGRQSATKLATFMNAFEIFMIEITKFYSTNDWREDIKKVMLQSGVASKSTVFLFCDNQIKDESYVEDVNMLLNTGDVPNIFAADEKAEIVEKMQGAARTEGRRIDATPLAMYNFFIERVKKNLHIVLGMAPRHFPTSWRFLFLTHYWAGNSVEKCIFFLFPPSRSDESNRRCVPESLENVPFAHQLLYH